MMGCKSVRLLVHALGNSRIRNAGCENGYKNVFNIYFEHQFCLVQNDKTNSRFNGLYFIETPLNLNIYSN